MKNPIPGQIYLICSITIFIKSKVNTYMHLLILKNMAKCWFLQLCLILKKSSIERSKSPNPCHQRVVSRLDIAKWKYFRTFFSLCLALQQKDNALLRKNAPLWGAYLRSLCHLSPPGVLFWLQWNYHMSEVTHMLVLCMIGPQSVTNRSCRNKIFFLWTFTGTELC